MYLCLGDYICHVAVPCNAQRFYSRECRLSRGQDIVIVYNRASVTCFIGTGTFGRVLLVRHRETREYLALKVLPIAEVIRLKQVEHVHNEKDILLVVRHPFIINL